MINYLRGQNAKLVGDESGAMAFLMLLTMPVIFIFFALALDAGVWYFDHRIAQNQADAAALAAVQHLPAASTTEASATVNLWLTKNGSGPADVSCLEYSDLVGGDGLYDSVRVCVRRQSPGTFSTLVGIPFVYVSAVAEARVGRATISNVKPWAIAPDDPGCRVPDVLCYADMDDEGNLEPCGYYPPLPGSGIDPIFGETFCPWGLHEDRLYRFKVADTYTTGNFGAIRACGSGGASIYKECITGDLTSEIYGAGQEVWVEVETGNMLGPTMGGLNTLYDNEDVVSFLPIYRYKRATDEYVSVNERTLECDVMSKPDPITGLDYDGKAAAEAKWVYAPSPVYCNRRLVSILIIDEFPDGFGVVEVLGFATFGIARWDRISPWNDAMGNGPEESCGQSYPADYGGNGGYPCGQIWGYLMRDAYPPQALLGGLGNTSNPFAPQIIALTE